MKCTYGVAWIQYFDNIILFPLGSLYLSLQQQPPQGPAVEAYLHFHGVLGNRSADRLLVPFSSQLWRLPLPSVVASWPVCASFLASTGSQHLEGSCWNTTHIMPLLDSKLPYDPLSALVLDSHSEQRWTRLWDLPLPASPKPLNLPSVSSAPAQLSVLEFFNPPSNTLPQGLCITCLYAWFKSLSCHLLQGVLPKCVP